MRAGDRVVLRWSDDQPVSLGTVRSMMLPDRCAVNLDQGGWLIVPLSMVERPADTRRRRNTTSETDRPESDTMFDLDDRPEPTTQENL